MPRTKNLTPIRLVFFAIVSVALVPAFAADRDAVKANPLLGRWDLTVNNQYPSWIQFRLSGYRTLVGEYVGQFGSVRPISKIDYDTNTHQFRFVVPPQWERRTNEIVVEGKIEGESLSGTVPNDDGKPVPFQGRPAPALVREHEPKWGQPIELFNGRDLSGWKPRNSNAKNGWRVQDGLLANASPGNDIMTERQFTDFKLHTEFRYPNGANSGIYLRGRYEVQIEDDFGLDPDSHFIGGVYGFLTPRLNTAKKAGEWQTLDLTLVGRILTVVLNGEPVIERQAIPGITGGALDSHEENPGPLLIQGDHGKVEFRKITLTPAK
jgi:hypothetical protein